MPPPPEPDDLLFRFRGAYKKQDGYVDVTARGVDWRGPDGASVSVAFADLAKHETSPKAHAKCMLKLTVPDKKPVVLTVLEASKDRAWDVLCDAKVTIATVLKRVRRTTPEARTKAAENALRADALARDGALRAEHRELVGGGVVCEADFWAARPPLATPAHAVKAAPSNELLVDAPSGGGPPSSRSRKELSFALSREKIDFLFDAYPAVRRAHAAHVPNDMSEEQFWVKYFQSRYFWRDKGAAVNNATPDDAVTDDLFARFEEPGDDAQREPRPVRPAVDLLRTAHDRDVPEPPDDPAFARPPPTDDAVAPTAELVLRKFNAHGDRVLAPAEGATEPGPLAVDDDDVDDALVDRPPPSVAALDLAHRAKGGRAAKPPARKKPKLFCAEPDDVAWTVESVDVLGALDASEEPARRALAVLDRASRKPDDGDPPPPSTKADVERATSRVHALLRYLRAYAAEAPATPAERAALDAKKGRVLDKLRSMKAALDAKRRSYRDTPAHAKLAALFTPIVNQLEFNLARHDN